MSTFLLALSLLCGLFAVSTAAPSAPPATPFSIAAAPVAPPTMDEFSTDAVSPSAPPVMDEDDDDDDGEAKTASISTGKTLLKTPKVKVTPPGELVQRVGGDVITSSSHKNVNGTKADMVKTEPDSVTIPMYAVYLIAGGSVAACAMAVGIALMLRYCKRSSEATKSSHLSIRVTETRA